MRGLGAGIETLGRARTPATGRGDNRREKGMGRVTGRAEQFAALQPQGGT